MVILWVLSCLALVSEAFVCDTPTIKLTPVSSECNRILKYCDLIHICDANNFRPTMQNPLASCEIIKVPRNRPGVVLSDVYNEICKGLEKELCGSRTDGKSNLFHASTANGSVTPLPLPINRADFENFRGEKCAITKWKRPIVFQKRVPPEQESFSLRNNEECRTYWLSKIRNTAMCALYPGDHGCEDVSGSLLVCGKEKDCAAAGIVYWGTYSNPQYFKTTFTRIFKYNHWDEIFPCN